MKEAILFTAFIIIHSIVFCQDTSHDLHNFLNKDFMLVLQDRVNTLTKESERINYKLNETEKDLNEITYYAKQSVSFLFFLQKLENKQALNSVDSSFFDRNYMSYYPPNSSGTITDKMYIVFNQDLLSFLIQVSDPPQDKYPFLNAFPVLKKAYDEQRLLIRIENLAASEAPAITMPPAPSSQTKNATEANKKNTAALWMNYIYDLSQLCGFPQTELAKYSAIEKKKVPDGNTEKLIELRQKCAMFIQVKYCHK